MYGTVRNAQRHKLTATIKAHVVVVFSTGVATIERCFLSPLFKHVMTTVPCLPGRGFKWIVLAITALHETDATGTRIV